MPLVVAASRHRIYRVARAVLTAFSIILLGSYGLLIWTDNSVSVDLKSLSFELEYNNRFAYANEDDSVASLLLPPEDTDLTRSGNALELSTAAERLLASGVGYCEQWTVPENDEEIARREPKSACWKDGHYRQLKSYLRHAETDKSFRELSWHDQINARNMRSLRALFDCLPYFGSMEALPSECSNNMLTVILSQDWWWDMALTQRSESGETVWLRTMVETLDEEHYTIVSLHHHAYQNLVKFHNVMPDVVTYIYAMDTIVLSCLSDPRCRSDFPSNTTAVMEVPAEQRGTVPSWKLFTLTYWGARPGDHGISSFAYGIAPREDFSFNPLGNAWTISPYPYPGHTHIPFTLEKACLHIDFIPHDQRKEEVTVLGKLYQYFYPHRMGLVSQDVWPSFQNETSLAPISNAYALKQSDLEQSTPPGLINRGPLPSANYTQQVAHSKALLAIGRPEISPSPYLALCLGVPVVLPYFGDKAVPEGWDLYHSAQVQHGPVASIGPPYVHNYRMGKKEDMYAAVRAARDTPIERYIPDEMRHAHVCSEILKLVNIDWLARSREVEAERVERGEQPQALVKQHIVERIYHRGVGRRMGENGEVLQTLPTKSDGE